MSKTANVIYSDHFCRERKVADVECCLLLELRVCETPIFFKF